MAAKSSNPPLVVIVGETASGKSALAMQLAEQFAGEIISADSWTVYKGFDVGTAKPDANERARIPHHLLDIADPSEGFSAAIFKRLAVQAIEDIGVRGKLPILVGGTGLYVDSVLYDYEFLPPPTPAERQALNILSLSELLVKATELGLDTEGIDLRNKRRVIRLIENNGVRPTKRTLRANTLVMGVRLSREELQAKIERRVDGMIAAGLEHEVQRLVGAYGWGAEPMKGIGYREWRAYFDDKQSLEETRQQITRGTLALAKKQRTWFKRNKSIHWVNEQAEAVAYATTFLNK